MTEILSLIGSGKAILIDKMIFTEFLLGEVFCQSYNQQTISNCTN